MVVPDKKDFRNGETGLLGIIAWIYGKTIIHILYVVINIIPVFFNWVFEQTYKAIALNWYALMKQLGILVQNT